MMASDGHVHRWRIGEPNGPRSEGVCACGEVRLFGNSEESMDSLTALQQASAAWRARNGKDAAKKRWEKSKPKFAAPMPGFSTRGGSVRE